MAHEQRHIMFEPGEVQAQQETLFSHGYTFIRDLGAGGFSKVCLVHSQRYKDMEFAAKISFRNKGETARQTAEVKMLHQIDHSNIIRIYDYFYDEKYVYTILEYCPNGSLMDMIRSNAIGRYDTMLHHMRGIASALALCHKQGIAHRDIKPANVLIDNYGRCKLADFGLGIVCVEGEKISSTAGSLAFSPPELFTQGSHDPFKADMWSLGILLYCMIMRHLPWTSKTREELKREIRVGSIAWPATDFVLTSLLRRLLCLDPLKRITAEEVLAHPVFAEIAAQKPQKISGQSSALVPSLSMSDGSDTSTSQSGKQIKLRGSLSRTAVLLGGPPIVRPEMRNNPGKTFFSKRRFTE